MLCQLLLFMFLHQRYGVEACSSIPQLSIRKKAITAEYGDNITIDCLAGPAASGNDHTFLNWFYNNSLSFQSNTKIQTLPDAHFADALCDKERLQIFGFRKDNSGKYLCQRSIFVHNDSDDAKEQTEIELIMKDPLPPKILFGSYSTNKIHLLYNTVKELDCKVSGSPAPDIRWMFKGTTIKECHGGSCSINITANNNASYVCSASNMMGKIERVLSVVVLGFPSLSKNKFFVNNNEFTCKAEETYPSSMILWKYQTVECNRASGCLPGKDWLNFSQPGIKVLHGSSPGVFQSTLVIQKRPFHAFVKCVAVNSVGNDSHIFKVNLNETHHVEVGLVTGIVCGTLVVLAVLFILLLYRRRYRRRRYSRMFSPYSDYQVKSDISLLDQSLHLPYDTSWEYPRNKLEFIKVLGSGAFGQVWLARAIHIYDYHKTVVSQNTVGSKRRLSFYDYIKRSSKNNNSKATDNGFVAVKTLKDDATEAEYKDLASEIKLLIHVGGNKNIVNLLGACTRNESLFAIIEYCQYGDLKTFLKSKRTFFVSDWQTYLNGVTSNIGLGDLCSIALQIAKGMAFLHDKKLIHRDLATRNVLLAENYCVKISDLGLARSVSYDDNYVKTTGGLLPVKWMSPESLFDRVYNTKTDVWSFAITLWEIFTLGGTPYPGIPIELLFDHVQTGNRMARPEVCPSEMFSIICECWSHDPVDRMEFPVLATQIDFIIRKYIKENSYLRLIFDENGNEIDIMNEVISDDLQSCSSFQGKHKKFSFASIIDFISFRKMKRSSNSEDGILNERLSSTNSEVFEHNIDL